MEQSNNPLSYLNFGTNFTYEKELRYPSLFPFLKAFWFFAPFRVIVNLVMLQILAEKKGRIMERNKSEIGCFVPFAQAYLR